MKILITGGFGYLGGRLAQFLANDKDHQIFLGSRSERAVPLWLPTATVIETNWKDANSFLEISKGMDVIVHAAGMNAQDCAQNPELALEFNGGGTKRLLDAAIQNNVKRFIYLSTAHVYANPLRGIINENHQTLNPHSYATSHLAGENFVREKHQNKEIEGVVVRLSNAFGAPTHVGVNCWMLLANDLCRQVVLTKKMVLNSTGVQRRDFIALGEACRALEFLINLPADKLMDGLFNVSGEWSPTIREMTHLIAGRFEKITGTCPEVLFRENTTGESSDVLEYKMDKLIQAGFISHKNKNAEKEIDELIFFCLKNAETLS